MINFADIVIELERRKTAEGIGRGGHRLVKMGRAPVSPKGYYYEMGPRGIQISTAPQI